VQQPLSRSFGQCVRFLWQAHGMTQVEFSEKCGFYQTYLSRIENGQANPTLNAMEVIAVALGLTVFELFERVRELTQDKRT
jgi:transcriptional regulator with XRE-family HTH domain